MSSILLTAGYPQAEEGDVGSNPIWITKIFTRKQLNWIEHQSSKIKKLYSTSNMVGVVLMPR